MENGAEGAWSPEVNRLEDLTKTSGCDTAAPVCPACQDPPGGSRITFLGKREAGTFDFFSSSDLFSVLFVTVRKGHPASHALRTCHHVAQIRFLQSSGGGGEAKVEKYWVGGYHMMKCSLWTLVGGPQLLLKQLIAILDLELIQQKGMELQVMFQLKRFSCIYTSVSTVKGKHFSSLHNQQRFFLLVLFWSRHDGTSMLPQIKIFTHIFFLLSAAWVATGWRTEDKSTLFSSQETA